MSAIPWVERSNPGENVLDKNAFLSSVSHNFSNVISPYDLINLSRNKFYGMKSRKNLKKSHVRVNLFRGVFPFTSANEINTLLWIQIGPSENRYVYFKKSAL